MEKHGTGSLFSYNGKLSNHYFKEVWYYSMNNFNWLHFSDLHLNCNKGISPSIIRKKLIEKLKKENFKCNYIFFTGDIVDKCQYENSIEYIKDIIETINTAGNNVRVFWAVGNHDISRFNNYRNAIVKKIRQSGSESFNFSLNNYEEYTLLTNIGMKEYYENYENICNEPISTIGDVHKLVILENLNLIILNTCLTSCDNKDERNLFVVNDELLNLFDNIDEKKPTFAIGHHGHDFLNREENYKLDDIFNNKVDVYLCGHAHRLGYNLFNNTENNIIELTCGGGIYDDYSKYSFIYGEFNANNSKVSITPYSYSEKGNNEWNKDFNLHRKIKENNAFALNRLDTVMSERKDSMLDYSIVLNARYNFSIGIPSGWSISHESENGDGFTIGCSNAEIDMRVFGSHDIGVFGSVAYFEMMEGKYSHIENFEFSNMKKGFIMQDENAVTFLQLSSDNSISISFYIDYKNDTNWFKENREMLCEIAKTLKFNSDMAQPKHTECFAQYAFESKNQQLIATIPNTTQTGESANEIAKQIMKEIEVKNKQQEFLFNIGLDWQMAYIQIIMRFYDLYKDKYDCTFALYDMDKNGVPELFLNYWYRQSYVYSFNNGKIKVLGHTYNELYKTDIKNGIISYGGFGTGTGGILLYTIESEQLKTDVICEHNVHPSLDVEQYKYMTKFVDSEKYHEIVEEYTQFPLTMSVIELERLNEFSIIEYITE